MDQRPSNHGSAKWVGYELHDGLLQWLVGARMMLEAKLDRAALDDSAQSGQVLSPEASAGAGWSGGEVKELLESTLLSLGAAIDEGRALITFLDQHAENLAFDIQQATEDFLDFVPRHTPAGDVSIQFERLDQSLLLASSVGWNVLRIIQQAVRNALFHSEASIVQVAFSADGSKPGRYRVSVQDDGCGFDVESAIKKSARANHFGLASMQHRAQQLGGDLLIASELGKGSQVEFDFPTK